MRRFPGIEGLRALAACSVLVGHVYPLGISADQPVHRWVTHHVLPVTSVGVTLFFTLSGFLLYRPLAAAVHDGRQLRIGAYARNRALRILPAYWVVLVIAGFFMEALVAGPGEGATGVPDAGHLAAWALLLQQFIPSMAFTGVPLAWSLVAEVCFYVALPLLALLAARLLATRLDRRAAVLVPVGVMSVVGLSGALFVEAVAGPGDQPFGQSWAEIVTRSFWGMGMLFCGGMLVAALHVRGRRSAPTAPLALLGLACVVVADRLQVAGTGGYLGYQTVMMVACTCLLALVVFDGAGRLTGALELRAVMLAGLVSYGIFLWHVPLAVVLDRHGLTADGAWAPLVNLPLVAGATALVAALSWLLVERPALRRKRRALPS